MSYALVIVESPAKCQKIEKLLGPGYRCVASFGHIRELKGLDAIDVAGGFTPTFTQMASKSKQISQIQQLMRGASEVIIASDDDREGEAIGWHVCEVLKIPISSTKRIVFHEITGTALRRAVESARVLDMNVVRAQQARQILDMLVGFKISPILWEKISYKTVRSLSAGRCQTPALRLVYDNQKEIDASPGRKVYKTTGYFTTLNIPFVLNFNHSSEDEMVEFLEETATHEHVYSCSKPRKVTKQPPQPFTTSTLQQAASNELKLSPKKTMDLCQKLYESGLITYMRTDSKTYSTEFVASAKKRVEDKFGADHVRDDLETLSERDKGDGAKNDNPEAQEAHEAIRPTDVTVERAPDGPEARLYRLIWRNTLESCMGPALFESITAKLTAPALPSGTLSYAYTVERVLFLGWKAVAGVTDPEPREFGLLRSLKPGSVLDYSKVASSVTLKDLGAHLTEARLVQLLEKRGVGRPSTFSSLVDKIQERGYVKKTDIPGTPIRCTDFELEGDELSETTDMRTFGNERNKLRIQPLGVLVIEFLVAHFDSLFAYEYTRGMENLLDEVASGNMHWTVPCQQCLDIIEKDAVVLEPKRISIPLDADHTYMVAKYGPVIKCTMGGKTTFKKVREDVDLDRLRRGEYKLAELVVSGGSSGRDLGEHEGHSVILKTGKYGAYAEWNGQKASVRLECPTEELRLEDVVPFLTQKPAGIIRSIDANTSIRTGQYGDYVFHKVPNAPKPVFIKLAPFIKEHGADVEWLSTDKRYGKGRATATRV
jgi:DNA topoisomerase-1